MEKMIFLNVGWMKNYKGLKSDKIVGGGSFVQEHGYGHEIFNFLPYNGYMYGYVQPISEKIRINRLGASEQDQSVDGVLAVWVSKSPSSGVFIVGWYKNATVYRDRQPAPKNSNRKYKRENLGYYIKAKAEDCTRLPIDKRVLKIPRGKGGMGQSNVWYADQSGHTRFKQNVLDFINEGKISKNHEPTKTKNGKVWQPDPYKRQKIEKIAIKMTTTHYGDLGYVVDSVEKDNAGWDLEATMNDKTLKLEVKGLSREEILIELTPNEYEKMKKYKDNYRICVVTNALSKRTLLTIFSFSPENGKWEDDMGNELKITEIVSAMMNA